MGRGRISRKSPVGDPAPQPSPKQDGGLPGTKAPSSASERAEPLTPPAESSLEAEVAPHRPALDSPAAASGSGRPPERSVAAPRGDDAAPMSSPAAEEKRTRRAPAGLEPYLTFWLGGEEYGLRVLQVREILEYQPVTPVPTTPHWIRGVMNLRGGVVPVVDLAVKFGLAKTAVTKRTCIVIVEVDLDGEAAVMGVITDAVSQVVELPPEAIETPPAFGTRVRVDYLLGVGRHDERLILILDADRVLSTDELLAASSLPVTSDGFTSPAENAAP